MKLLHVIASADPVGGGPIEGLIRQNEATRDVAARHLVTLDPPDAPFLRDFPIAVTALGAPRRGGWRTPLERYGYSRRLIPWLRAHAADYDAVVVEGLWNYATFGAAAVLPGSGVPYFVFTHGMMDPWFRRTYPIKHLAKQVFWLACEGRLLAGAKAVLFTTKEERQLARGQFLGWSYREAVVGYGTAVPPAETPAHAAARRATMPALADRSYLVFLSRIHRKKGCDLLVEAFAKVAHRCPDLDLVIAGPDQEGLVDTLKARAESLGVAHRLHWPGMLGGDAKWGAYRGAEAFVLPSHQENFGIVVAEALGCGTPVLITDKVNIWREVQTSGAGYVEPDDIAGVERLLTRWLATSETDRRHMAVQAKEAFMQYFDVTRVAPALLAVIRRQEP